MFLSFITSLINQEKQALIGALHNLIAKLGAKEDIHAIGALNDQSSRMIEANMTQCNISDFFKIILHLFKTLRLFFHVHIPQSYIKYFEDICFNQSYMYMKIIVNTYQ